MTNQTTIERDLVERLAERPESDDLAWEAISEIVGLRSANRRLRTWLRDVKELPHA